MPPDGVAVAVPDLPTTPGPDRLAAAVEAAGADAHVVSLDDLATTDGAGDVAHLDAVVAAGDDALRSVAEAEPVAPVLPVDVSPGVRSVAAADLEAAVEHLVESAESDATDAVDDSVATDAADDTGAPDDVADVESAGPDGPVTTERHPVIAVSVGDEHLGVALRETTLLTAEPARISEFAVDGATTGTVDVVRADGVVVATPAGSRGYAAAGEGPLLAPETGLSVVPVAPFRVDRTRWVLPVEEVTVTVRRDDAAITVEVDGADRVTIGREPEVTLAPTATVETLVVPQSGPTFPRRRRPADGREEDRPD